MTANRMETNKQSHHRSYSRLSSLTACVSGAALAFSLVIAGVLPSLAAEDRPFIASLDHDVDLGVDVTNLPTSLAEVRKFAASLSDNAYRIITKSCEQYLRFPSAARMRETLTFCVLIGL